jgi:NAD(P)-dependent dehydrogenase (short-subunit alcohol dehydrogenase family)
MIENGSKLRGYRSRLEGPRAVETDATKSNGKTVFVSGASSGIVEAAAERVGTAGFKVFGASRRGARAGQPSFGMLSLDVTSEGHLGDLALASPQNVSARRREKLRWHDG